jgi:hypothetical protein
MFSGDPGKIRTSDLRFRKLIDSFCIVVHSYARGRISRYIAAHTVDGDAAWLCTITHVFPVQEVSPKVSPVFQVETWTAPEPLASRILSPILTRLQENADRCILSQTYDSRLDREELSFAADCKAGQQIPKRTADAPLMSFRTARPGCLRGDRIMELSQHYGAKTAIWFHLDNRLTKADCISVLSVTPCTLPT